MIPPREGVRTFPPSGLAKTELVSPRTIAEACDLLSRASVEGKRAVLLCGGTDWIVDRHLMAPEKVTPVDTVIDLTKVAALSSIGFHEENGERRMVLGGGVTYWALRRDARVLGTVPMLATMARDVGAVQIQTRGTLAGNLASASPAADGVPALDGPRRHRGPQEHARRTARADRRVLHGVPEDGAGEGRDHHGGRPAHPEATVPSSPGARWGRASRKRSRRSRSPP